MAKIPLLVDTDIFIDFFNRGDFSGIIQGAECEVYYSVITEKELLTKPGLSDAEKRAINKELRRHRRVSLSDLITVRYSRLRSAYAGLSKEDALIAATALAKNLPLFTRNKRHFRMIEGLALFG